MPGSFIVSPGDGRVITDLASCGKTNWRDLPSGIVIVYFDVSSLVMVGPSVIRPRVLLESGVPQTLIALARAGHGVAVLPSAARVHGVGVRVAVVVHRRVSIGRWAVAAWDAQRVLPRYAAQFVEELAAQCRRNYPNREYVRRAPPLPRPKEQVT